jgi:cytosine/adenosine deaminase-related metal-dependent hydrolase
MKILAANYVLPVTSEPISDGAIVIENDKIIAVGTRQEIHKQFVNVEIEDFNEAVIMPSFINTHSHLELTAFRGFLDDVEHDFFSWLMKLTISREKLSNEDIENSALIGTLEGLRAGITCFADIGRYGFAGFKALKKHGLRGISFQETEFSPDNSTAGNDFAKLEEKFLCLKADETNLVKVGISPHSPYTVSPKLFEKIADYSMQNKVKLTIHAAESEAETELLKHGKGKFAEMFANRNVAWKSPQTSSIQYLRDLGVLQTKPLLAHCITVDDRDVELISASGSSVAHCPKSNAKLGHGIAPFEKFLNQSIKIGFGSDSVASNNVCDILEESRFASLFARSKNDSTRLITPKDVLNTATYGGAEALGLENETGSLEAGKQADLIVIKLDNIAQQPIFDIYATVLFATSAREVYLTMCAGKEVFRDGKALKIDEIELKNKLKEIAEKIK